MPLFPFVQLEYTHSIGPPPGRYIVHPYDRNGSESFAAGGGYVPTVDTPYDQLDAKLMGTADVLVVQVRGASAPSPKRFRSGLPRATPGEQPAELSVTIVTVILATRMIRDERLAPGQLTSVRNSVEEQHRILEAALAIVRRGVSAYRLAAADPYVPDLSPLDARAARIGYGEAGDVVRGSWTEAVGVPLPKPQKVNRTTQLMPVQAMAAILNGSMGSLQSEEMILAAVRDIDNGRLRGAAVTINAAQELLLAELAGEELPAKVARLVAKVESTRDAVRELASRAVLDRLTNRDEDALREYAEDAGALIDAWRYVPLGFA
jgi:hypothetical protein